jgi:hypothetical protein
MLLDQTQPASQKHQEALATFDARLRESEMFHSGTGQVHKTLQRLAEDLETAGIPYAIIGAMALNAHGYPRETVDVDVLVTREGLDAFHNRYVGRGYRPEFPGARKSFRNTVTNVKVEFITAGEYPGDGKPKPVVFPDPAAVATTIGSARIVSLPKLIELKLASGMTNPARLRDLADVQDLIRILGLDEALGESLDTYVRQTYLDLLHAVRMERNPEE